MASTPVVIPGTPPAAAAPPAAAPAAPPAEDITALKARLATLESENAEGKRVADYWYKKANTAAPAEPAKAKEPAEPDVDLLDVITTQGAKGLISVLKKQGLFITKEEANHMVDSKAGQLTTEAQLLKDYPDLADKKSDFFQTTAGFYDELKKAGVPPQMAMSLAAERAELQLIRDGKIQTPAEKKAADKAQKEADRLARIAAQQGGRGGRGAEPEDDDVLSENDEAAVRQLADALDIPVDKARERYIARAKAGVNVSLKLDRRGR